MSNSDPLDRWLDDGGAAPTRLPRRRFGARPQRNPLPALLARLEDLAAEVRRAWMARIDLTRVRIRDALVQACLLSAGAILAMAVAIAAGVLLLVGLGEGLGHALGGRIWLGNVLVGLLTLGLIGGAAFLLLARMRRNSLLERMAKYERDEPDSETGNGRAAAPSDRTGVSPVDY